MRKQKPAATESQPELVETVDLNRLSQILPDTVLLLMQKNPALPEVRGFILKHTKMWVPEDLTTFEAMAIWLQKNYAPQALEVSMLPCKINHNQTGVARFTTTQRHNAEIPITAKMVRDAFAFSGGSWHDFEHQLYRIFTDEIGPGNYTGEYIQGTENTTYDGHETEEDTYEVATLEPHQWDTLAVFAQRVLGPEKWDQLNNGDNDEDRGLADVDGDGDGGIIEGEPEERPF